MAADIETRLAKRFVQCDICGKDLYYDAASDRINDGALLTKVLEGPSGEVEEDYILCWGCFIRYQKISRVSRPLREAV